MTFPTAPEDLTADWLSATLNTQIDEFRVEHFGEGAGIIGMVTRLHLTGPDAPATIIAKFPSPAEENRAVAATYDMYQREVNFYRQIADQINLRVPDCYCAEFDPERSEFVDRHQDQCTIYRQQDERKKTISVLIDARLVHGNHLITRG